MRKALLAVAMLVAGACSDGNGGPSDSGAPAGNGTEHEPNDTLATATPISPGASMSGSISSSLDTDYFRFEVGSPNTIVRVEISGTSVTLCASYPYMELLDSNGVLLGLRAPGMCEDYYALLGPGAYYVKLSSSPVPFAYQLMVTPSPGSVQDAEPNGDVASASGPFTIPSTILAGLIPEGDVDYFAISNTSGSSVSLTISTWIGPDVGVCGNTLYLPNQLQPVLSLAGSDGVFIAHDFDMTHACPWIVYTFPPNTTYYAMVAERWGNAIPAYGLSVSP